MEIRESTCLQRRPPHRWAHRSPHLRAGAVHLASHPAHTTRECPLSPGHLQSRQNRVLLIHLKASVSVTPQYQHGILHQNQAAVDQTDIWKTTAKLVSQFSFLWAQGLWLMASRGHFNTSSGSAPGFLSIKILPLLTDHCLLEC